MICVVPGDFSLENVFTLFKIEVFYLNFIINDSLWDIVVVDLEKRIYFQKKNFLNIYFLKDC